MFNFINIILPALILFLSLGCILYTFVLYSNSSRVIATVAIIFNLVLFQLGVGLLGFIDYNNSYYNLQVGNFDSINALLIKIADSILWQSLLFGVDSISILFLIITVLITSCALVIGTNTRIFGSIKFFTQTVQIIQFMLIIIFSTTDLFLFYVAFEGLTIPTFFLIFVYGAEITKLRAARLFIIYSFLSSTCLGFALSLLYLQFQTSSLNQLSIKIILALENNTIAYSLSSERYVLIYLLLIIGFGIKIPIAPFHMWLPEAHAEASTAGSVILAGLILKLGGYGIVRFILPLFGSFTLLNPYIQTTCLISIFFVSCSCLRTTNIKQIIAYTSIIHMNTTTIGLFSQQSITLAGSLVSMVSHSLVASGLFICAGTLYNRFGVYELQYFGGLSQTMPFFTSMFTLLTLSNIALPLTLAFIGEFTVLVSLCKANLYIFLILLTLLGLNTIYSLWVLNRVIYTDVTSHSTALTKTLIKFQDLDFNEICTLSSLLILIIWLGINPNLLNSFIIYLY